MLGDKGWKGGGVHRDGTVGCVLQVGLGDHKEAIGAVGTCIERSSAGRILGQWTDTVVVFAVGRTQINEDGFHLANNDGGCGCGVIVVVVVVVVVVFLVVIVGFVGNAETSSSHDGHHWTRRWKGYEGRLDWWKGDVLSGVVDILNGRHGSGISEILIWEGFALRTD